MVVAQSSKARLRYGSNTYIPAASATMAKTLPGTSQGCCPGSQTCLRPRLRVSHSLHATSGQSAGGVRDDTAYIPLKVCRIVRFRDHKIADEQDSHSIASMFSFTIHSSTLSTRLPYVADVATLAAKLRDVVFFSSGTYIVRQLRGSVPLQVPLVILRVGQKLVHQHCRLERLDLAVRICPP